MNKNDQVGGNDTEYEGKKFKGKWNEKLKKI